MKKKLFIDDDDSEDIIPKKRFKNDEAVDYDPKYFLRCHSRGNDEADLQTQVWHCVFEPNIEKPHLTTNIVATCGGNSVCLIDVTTGKCVRKFTVPNHKELLYSLCWTTITEFSDELRKVNLLVTAGCLGKVHILHPDSNSHLTSFKVNPKGRRWAISSLLFHPKHTNLLFCIQQHRYPSGEAGKFISSFL